MSLSKILHLCRIRILLTLNFSNSMNGFESVTDSGLTSSLGSMILRSRERELVVQGRGRPLPKTIRFSREVRMSGFEMMVPVVEAMCQRMRIQ